MNQSEALFGKDTSKMKIDMQWYYFQIFEAGKTSTFELTSYSVFDLKIIILQAIFRFT